MKKQTSVKFSAQGGLLICALWALLLLQSCNVQKRILINPEPTNSLTVYTDKPVYYYVQDTLYYAPHGDLDLKKPIWQGKISERFYEGEVSVAPNSAYVVIGHETGLDVIDSVGTKICRIRNVRRNIFERDPDTFWTKGFQWSADSKALFLIKDMQYSHNGNPEQRLELVKLDIAGSSLTTVYNFIEKPWGFYLGTHNTIYYTAYDRKVENWQLKKVDLETKAITPIYTDEGRRLKTTDTIYANLEFEQREYNNHIRIERKSYEDCDIYAKNDDGTQQLLFEVQCGASSWDKNKRYGIIEMNSDVYMAGQYYFGMIYTEKYSTMIVDLKTLEYTFCKEYIKPYVASAIATENLIYIGTELRVK
ncbi:MAG: hypothetical protein EOP54_19495 [Sphingobacteriales bacterium]|nr:MAG: hypothetical protein EOP54_19495 [Sphingobacteriales bacterium]